MADEWTTQQPDQGAGSPPTRPFDRQALQATLADAVRTADAATPDPEDTPPMKPLRGPSPQEMIGTASVAVDPTTVSGPPSVSSPAANGAPADAPRAPASRSVNPFSRPTTPPVPGVNPSPAPGSPTRPAPSLLGGGEVPAVGTPQSGPTLSSLTGGSSGLGGLRTTSPGNLGPINFSGEKSATSVAPPAPEQRPTIPLRKRPTGDSPSTAKAADMAPPAQQSAPAAPNPGTRSFAPIDAWSPSDDDILPRRQPKRSFRLKR